MKLIIAIIQPEMLESVKKELRSEDVTRMTVTEVQGFGNEPGHVEVYRGQEFPVNMTQKLRVEIACNDDFVEPTVSAICKAGKTSPEGSVGDGKIMITDLQEVIRIRTGERGSEAI